MLILSVDSSASPASVALYDKKLIAEYYTNSGLTHSQTLVAMIESVLSVTGIKPEEVDLFAVNNGPGSFTGVRIGVSAVKGMAYAYQKTCAAISTLESMAYNFLASDAVVCCSMDARRQQVYNALFRIKDSVVTRLCDDRAISVEALCEELKCYDERVILAGDGAELVYQSCSGLGAVRLAPDNLRYQRASSTALVAVQKTDRGELIDAKALIPSYLRLSQAEREMLNKQKGSVL